MSDSDMEYIRKFPSVKYWEILENRVDLLSRISGVPKKTFSENLGWMLVEDWSKEPRYLIIPKYVFKLHYLDLYDEALASGDVKPEYDGEVLESLRSAVKYNTDMAFYYEKKMKEERKKPMYHELYDYHKKAASYWQHILDKKEEKS